MLKTDMLKTTVDFLKLLIGRLLGINLMGNCIEDIFNYLPLSESIATAGQPTEEQFSAIKAAGYQTVINLALPQSVNALANEHAIVTAQGMQYFHIPVLWESPTLEDFEQFVAAMKARGDKPVFVHCAANMRVSAFMYLYRRIYEGASVEQAEQDLHHLWTPNEIWQQFIQQVLSHYSK
jgi:uncharacterized protein (TIGR01244 family)